MKKAAPKAPGATLRIRVQPRASRNALRPLDDGRWHVALTAPPVSGSANKALCAFLSKRLGVAKSALTLVAGGKSRDKTVHVAGLSMKEIDAALGEED